MNPDLIMVRMSGYGQMRPYSKRAGYASVGETMGGLHALIGEPDRKIRARWHFALWDNLATLFATLAR